ncbi:MAG: riboflavin synthase [Rhizobiales bacterium]|nr:riboflavin synthase [Rhizobacter sp.]
MFTGIVTGLGRITQSRALGSDAAHGKQLTLEAPRGYLDDVQLGDSIALNGACMTVTSFDAATSRFTVDISAESLDKTAGFAELGPVNLEKALRANDRLGGHMVSGHVDGIGRVTLFQRVGESWELRIRAPLELARFIAYKGSITVNGVSLTVNRVIDPKPEFELSGFGQVGSDHGGCELSINLIPHTLQNTTLGTLKTGSQVNLEIDLIARYVERMLTAPGGR